MCQMHVTFFSVAGTVAEGRKLPYHTQPQICLRQSFNSQYYFVNTTALSSLTFLTLEFQCQCQVSNFWTCLSSVTNSETTPSRPLVMDLTNSLYNLCTKCLLLSYIYSMNPHPTPVTLFIHDMPCVWDSQELGIMQDHGSIATQSVLIQLLCFLTFSACTTVLGKPSSRNPFLHSGLSRLLSMSSTTSSSLTSWPASITVLIRLPSSDPDAITARSMSPDTAVHGSFIKSHQVRALTDYIIRGQHQNIWSWNLVFGRILVCAMELFTE